jgi:hypothetical protein
LNDKSNKETELEQIKNTTINKMWLNELNNLRELYIEYKAERARAMSGEEKKKKVVSKGTNTKKVVKKTKLIIEDN